MKTYTINVNRYNCQLGTSRDTEYSGTITELIDTFTYELECGAAYQHERGAHKISLTPKTAKSLVTNLNNVAENCVANGCSNKVYSLV